jgi:hypothetical protein
MTRMNIFTTDHPLTLQASWFDTRKHPLLSFVWHVSVMALIFTPLILVGLYFYFTSDIGAEPNPFPDPWLDLAVGTALSFVIGLACASLVALTYRLLARAWSRNRLTKPPEPGC